MLIVVKATWDPEASVWVAETDDVPGLITEADTLEALQAKIPGMIQDLKEV
jgi:predicted RNase H-like HicB family nuclease